MSGRGSQSPSAARHAGPLNLRLPAVPATVPEMRAAAREAAEGFGASPEVVADIALAVSEAVTNAVKYAYSQASSGEVELDMSLVDGRIQVVVRDHGGGFKPGPSDGLGMGLTIIAECARELKISQGNTGTSLEMAFRLAGR
jgi:serine/threonine-protein kinase RsbW